MQVVELLLYEATRLVHVRDSGLVDEAKDLSLGLFETLGRSPLGPEQGGLAHGKTAHDANELARSFEGDELARSQVNREREDLAPVLHACLHSFGKTARGVCPARLALASDEPVLGDQGPCRNHVEDLPSIDYLARAILSERPAATGTVRGRVREDDIRHLAHLEGPSRVARLPTGPLAALAS